MSEHQTAIYATLGGVDPYVCTDLLLTMTPRMFCCCTYAKNALILFILLEICSCSQYKARGIPTPAMV